MFRNCILLGCLAYVTMLEGALESGTDVGFRCAPNHKLKCVLSNIKLLNPDQSFVLFDGEGKKNVNIIAGSIEALRTMHCKKALHSFEKVSIGKVGLKELCIAPRFLQVSAENNYIRKLHVEEAQYRIESLKLANNWLDSVDEICAFSALKELDLQGNALRTLNMACFEKMTKLENLCLADNRLSHISAGGELLLPTLHTIRLQNNTLTNVDFTSWKLPALEQLDLASNNLTIVYGIEHLEELTRATLAGNRWECLALDRMLETLEENGVEIKDGDLKCSGIRNSTICCTSEDQPSEDKLLHEMQKIAELKTLYEGSKNMIDEAVQNALQSFDKNIELIKSSLLAEQQKASERTATTEPSTNNVGTADNGDENVTTTEASADVKDQAQKQASTCTCSKESLEQVEKQLNELTNMMHATNATLGTILDKQAQVGFMTVIAKHEFRTAAKRGEQKLNELSSMLGMLREHLEQRPV